MKLVNSKTILECETEDDINVHNQEILTLFEKVNQLENYECAVLCKFQDKAHKHLQTRVESILLHDIDEVYQWGDFKNGVDLLIDENNEYFVLVTYGQSYQIKGENDWHTVIEAFKILPYNKDEMFINIVDWALCGQPVKIANNQFETKLS